MKSSFGLFFLGHLHSKTTLTIREFISHSVAIWILLFWIEYTRAVCARDRSPYFEMLKTNFT